MNKYGFARIVVASPICSVGDTEQNEMNISNMMLNIQRTQKPDVLVFPELCITGYTCNDLFRSQLLIDKAEEAVAKIAMNANRSGTLIFVGAPVAVGNELFNCAIAIWKGRVLGIVPKQNIPNYNEFYESRWFRAADGNEPKTIKYADDSNIPFGIDLIFDNGSGLKIHAEICEDVWMPIPPSSYAAIAGANVLVNLSASNETVAKCEYRTDLVRNQSGRCVAAYAYSSAGPTESTTDLVFGGHCLIAENSHLLAETRRVGDGSGLLREAQYAVADVDVEKLMSERRVLSSFGDAARSIAREYRSVPYNPGFPNRTDDLFEGLKRKINGAPFIPKDLGTLGNRCAEIVGIQVAGLAKRIESIPSKRCYIGISGGLDSTLALLITVEAYRGLGLSPDHITGITMPGFGTTSRTKNNAIHLMEILGVKSKTIDIRKQCIETMISMGHDPFGVGWYHPSVELDKMSVEAFEDTLQHLSDEQLAKGDLVFENVQARTRTMVLMSHGFVVGTGDLSELALGWCTYNGDHMSMYNPNCSIPKTLVKFLVSYIAHNRLKGPNASGGHSGPADGIPDPTNRLFNTLMDIVNTMISPELLPHSKDKITQSTEDNIGPYELHDFFLVNFVRNGFSPDKIMYLAQYAEFSKKYSKQEIQKTLVTFLKRFFSQQFKRSCVPDGPKVGSVSLSPRGDWRMPSDASARIWLEGQSALTEK